MKVATTILLFTLLVATYAQTCTYTKTVSDSIVPTSDTLFVQSLDPYFDNFNIKWDTSFTNAIQVSMSVCSSSQVEFNAFSYSVTNNNGVFVSLQRTTTATGNNGGSTSTSGAVSGVTGNSTTSTTGTAPTPQPNAGTSISPSLLFSALAACLLMPNKRISIAVLAVAALFFMASPYSANASIASTNTQITITIAVPSSINNFCVSSRCFNRTSNGDVAKYVSMFGKRYSGMGGMDLKCNSSQNIALNAGWAQAEDTREALLAIYMYGFDSWLVVTKNRLAYESRSNGVVNGPNAAFEIPNAFGPGVNGYRVQNCDARLLITQDFPAPEPATDIIAPPRISPDNVITFAGYDYGVADNVPKSTNTEVCPTLVGVYMDGTSAWELAPNEDASYIAVADSSISFGSQCINYADGSTYMAPGGWCPRVTFIPVSYNGGMIYYSPNCSRILLRRPSTRPNSWTTQYTIPENDPSYVVTVGSNRIATLSATRTNPNSVACQQDFLAVPTGWRIATPAETLSFAQNQMWTSFNDVWCFTTEGASYTHEGASCYTLNVRTVGGVKYYQPQGCAQVLIYKL